MLEVKIDLVPMGDRDRTKQIGYAKIWNDASGGSTIGNYGYEVHDENDVVIIRGKYECFKRLEKSAFHLFRDILNKR